MSDWWPFLTLALGGTVWTLLCILVAQRWERHDGPLSFAAIPVFLGWLVLVGVVEWVW